MHELSISRNIVEIVREAAAGRPVRVVTVEIGKLSGVFAESVRFCFDVVAKGTAVEGAELELREIDGRARCKRCNTEFAAPTLFTPCSCGSNDVQWLKGQELNIKSIELAEGA